MHSIMRMLSVTFDIRLRSGRNSGDPALAIALNDLKRLQNSVNAQIFRILSREIAIVTAQRQMTTESPGSI